jgi:hypothetical protein
MGSVTPQPPTGEYQYTEEQGTAYVQKNIDGYKNNPVFGYKKTEVVVSKVINVLGYIPGLGTLMGLFRLWNIKREVKVVNSILTSEVTKNVSEITKSQLKEEFTKYKTQSIARGVIETLSLGIVLAPVDAAVTWIRGTSEKGKSKHI